MHVYKYRSRHVYLYNKAAKIQFANQSYVTQKGEAPINW